MARIVFWMFIGLLAYNIISNSSSNTTPSDDPHAGTTLSREYQEAWERSNQEFNRRHANEIPDNIRRILDTMPSSPGK